MGVHGKVQFIWKLVPLHSRILALLKLTLEYPKGVRYNLIKLNENQGCSLENQSVSKNHDLRLESTGQLQSNSISPHPRDPITFKRIEEPSRDNE